MLIVFLLFSLLCLWIVFLGGAERVRGIFSLLTFDLIDLFTEPLSAQQVRLCVAITWCIAAVIAVLLAMR